MEIEAQGTDDQAPDAAEPVVLDEGRAVQDEVCACCTGGSSSART